MYSSVEEHLKISSRNFPILVKMGYFEIEVRRRKLLSYFCEKELLLNNTIMTMPQTQESYLLSTIDTFAYVRYLSNACEKYSRPETAVGIVVRFFATELMSEILFLLTI